LGTFKKMDKTSLVKRIREEKVPGHMKRIRPKKSWDEVVKEDIKKRVLCINDAQDRNKWRRCFRTTVDPGKMGRRSCHQGRTKKKKTISKFDVTRKKL